jgi:hypothetical protein
MALDGEAGVTVLPALTNWLLVFAFTQLIEVPIYRRALNGRTLVAFGASTLTHPVVWFVFPRWGAPLWVIYPAAEAFAVLVEAGYLRLFGLRPFLAALGWSLLANAASFGLGILCHFVFGWP